MTDATITNLIKEGNGIRVFVSFSDDTSASYMFDSGTTKDLIRNFIKGVIQEKEFLIKTSSDLGNQLVGKKITL